MANIANPKAPAPLERAAHYAVGKQQHWSLRAAAALKELRLACPHPVAAAYKDRGERGIRVCVDCGLMEHGRWGTYAILKGAALHPEASQSALYEAAPFPAAVWKICHVGAHPVPAYEMAGETEYCREHIPGVVCPSCHGRKQVHDSGDGHGGLLGGRYLSCGLCGRKGWVSQEAADKYLERR